MHKPHIVVVGAGIVGLSTAFALLKQGMARVTVLEQAQIDHQRGASHGLSRLLRHEYGADRLYTDMVKLSLRRWKNFERRTGRKLYTPTGLLTLGREDDGFTKNSYYTLREAGLIPERLTHRTCALRFPQFQTQDYDIILHTMDAGILHASTCLQTLKESIHDLGGSVLENCQVKRITYDNLKRPVRLELQDGHEIMAERVVLATGSWVHQLLGHLRLPIRLTRQYLLYFENLSPVDYGLYAFPAFMANDLYGFPIHTFDKNAGNQWLKAATHHFGTSTTPDEDPVIDSRVIEQSTQELSHLLPALRNTRLAHIDGCIYDVSPDETFILDYLPDDPRITFATGLSGHGFKFGLLLGELLSSMICENEPAVPLERFRLDRLTQAMVQGLSVA